MPSFNQLVNPRRLSGDVQVAGVEAKPVRRGVCVHVIRELPRTEFGNRKVAKWD
jgi:hypothetical protein